MDLLALWNDPNFRAIAITAVRDTLQWAYQKAKSRYEGAPQKLSAAAEGNLDEFTVRLAYKLSERLQADARLRQHLLDNVSSPTGALELERSMASAVEIDDAFVRESLAALVARTITSRKETRERLATRAAIDACRYLGERQMRLLAFIAGVTGIVPDGEAVSTEQWSPIVVKWARKYVTRVAVKPEWGDLSLLASASLVSVMPRISRDNLPQEWAKNGIMPNLTELFADPSGQELFHAYDLVRLHRLNIAGVLLGCTAWELITGESVEMVELIREAEKMPTKE